MKVETVLGPVLPESLGITLPHEHLFLDNLARLVKPADKSLSFLEQAPVSIENLWAIRKMPFACKDNLVLTDFSIACEEVLHFKRYSGRSIVDLTPLGFGRNIEGLKKVSLKTGINVIAATGYYRAESHPKYVQRSSIEELEQIMSKELTEGINNTGIKAGVIKCALSQPLISTSSEKKVLQAAARAQSKTNSALTVHPIYYSGKTPSVETTEKCLEIYMAEGGNPKKFYFSHSQGALLVEGKHMAHYERLFDIGITLDFEFGHITYEGSYILTEDKHRTSGEIEKIKTVIALCNQGYDKQITLSQDVYQKMHLKKFGGYGYSHVLETVVPILKAEGVNEKKIDNMLIENPKRLLQK